LPADIVDKTQPDNPATAATPKEIRDELKSKLDEVQALHDHLDSGANDTKAPEGIKPEELTEQRRLVESLIFFYQEGLNSLAATEAEQEQLKLTEAQARKWTGFPDPPPYSMLMLYGLEEEADSLRGKQAVLETSLVAWQGDSAIPQAQVSRAQADARLTGETVERADSPADSASAVWRRDFAELRVRSTERNVWYLDVLPCPWTSAIPSEMIQTYLECRVVINRFYSFPGPIHSTTIGLSTGNHKRNLGEPHAPRGSTHS
jgi:potassium efflux system protein